MLASGYEINWNEIYYYFLVLFCHVLSPILVTFPELNTFVILKLLNSTKDGARLSYAVPWLSQSVNQPVKSAFCKPSRSVLPGMSNP